MGGAGDRSFIDLHGRPFDQCLGQEPGHGGAEFIYEAGDHFGLAGEHGADGNGGDCGGGHV
jgi:hypothetical protein